MENEELLKILEAMTEDERSYVLKIPMYVKWKPLNVITFVKW